MRSNQHGKYQETNIVYLAPKCNNLFRSVFIRAVSSSLQFYLTLDSSAKADGTNNSESVLCNSTFIIGDNEAEAIIRRCCKFRLS